MYIASFHDNKMRFAGACNNNGRSQPAICTVLHTRNVYSVQQAQRLQQELG